MEGLLKFFGLKWRRCPIGYWNGQRIRGATARFNVFFDEWFWRPIILTHGNGGFWLCLRVEFEWVYGEHVSEDTQSQESTNG